jgi:hypothetical protein
MDFYEQLKSKVDGKLVEAFEAAKRKLALLQKRERESKEELTTLKEQRETLTTSADISLADNVNAWDKFQVSLKKLDAQIVSLSGATEALEKRIIPEAQKEVDRTLNALQKNLREICFEQAQTVTEQINGLFAQIIELSDNQYNATRKIYSDFGSAPSAGERFTPILQQSFKRDLHRFIKNKTILFGVPIPSGSVTPQKQGDNAFRHIPDTPVVEIVEPDKGENEITQTVASEGV